MLIFIPVILYAILLRVNEYRGWCDLERYLLGDVCPFYFSTHRSLAYYVTF